ncbi:MAG TPA: Asp-tRNA(Asn)/Glu-tRNA(Gln) amidotransferase subunit GatB [Clostridiales bacterium]|jgi:aspartyl-tRNA(Asn)/glutamyl-tRNA(Gln) amidotransferase subunit B|nr:Asp-tRNA(Asn)/Glu-tRNA(Gln) amidotransferase subunit GatB [Clostridiales bacterium]
MTWETVIGLEVHVELATKSKIFCGCSTEFGGAPNTHCCPVCAGMPGTLPVLNKKVLEYALVAGIALGCKINRYNKFDRKNYFYPDLPKAYQISQLYLPFARDGRVEYVTRSGQKKVARIREIHMEEDAGKLIHSPYGDVSYPDFNRCGVPLIEIVSEPDFRDSEEVLGYLMWLKSTFEYLGISDVRMEEGSMRADINLSVRPGGSDRFGVRTEMKNINSFKAIERAIIDESKRQIELLEAGGRVIQETRKWDDNKGRSFSMRTKENAQDYRYFPEPNIPPILISEELLRTLAERQPELAHEKRERYIREYGLSDYDAGLLTEKKALAELFERTADLCSDPKETANWMLGDMMYLMNRDSVTAEELNIDPAQFADFVIAVRNGIINRTVAKSVFEKIFASHDFNVAKYIEENNLRQIDDAGRIRRIASEVIAENPKTVAQYKSGKTKVFAFFIGQTMRRLQGKANPSLVNEIVTELLNHAD